ncbi:MAG TPA: hypothetical protein VGO61_15940 [Steroidobacteraceae bacterium]|jgi:hypothetical protein|nr:hypothetical protein [Steroidobacteraceae bacterium]
MSSELPLLAALMAMAGFIALPAVVAFLRRRASVEASEVATQLTQFALAVRRHSSLGARCEPLDATLQQRARRLRIPEFASLALALELIEPRPELLADAAQRLALRLKRRVAFERKMLARTASGRRRGAATAATAPLVLLSLRAAGIILPVEALGFLLLVEGCGCWMLWRLARVEI